MNNCNNFCGCLGISSYMPYNALMPPDNVATVAVGGNVDFPNDGPNSNTGITRLSADSFNLTNIGAYYVEFFVSVDEPGQLIITLNGADLPYTVSGRATGTSLIYGVPIIKTTTANSTLTIQNPNGNSTALTITPNAGGTRAASAHLIIEQIG